MRDKSNQIQLFASDNVESALDKVFTGTDDALTDSSLEKPLQSDHESAPNESKPSDQELEKVQQQTESNPPQHPLADMVLNLPTNALIPSTRPIRWALDADAVQKLEVSIAQMGVVTPLIVRPIGSGLFVLISGHHRLQAAKNCGLERVPCMIRILADKDADAITIHEAMGAPIPAIEKARLMMDYIAREFALDQVALQALDSKIRHKKRLSDPEQSAVDWLKSSNINPRSFLVNHAKIVALPDEVMDLVRANRISARAAVLLAKLEREDRLSFIQGNVSGVITVKMMQRPKRSAAQPIADRLYQWLKSNTNGELDEMFAVLRSAEEMIINSVA